MNKRRKILDLFEDPATQKKLAENIERYRKGDARITIVDQNGDPMKGAKVRFTQSSHEFRFGANIFMLDEMETKEKNDKYKAYFAGLFNMATLPFYWKDTEPVKGMLRYDADSPKIYRRPPVGLCMEFCKKHGIEPREHALAYEQFFPEWLRGADTETTKRELERRFSEIAERYADDIPTIEVTNEMFWKEGVTEFYKDPDYVSWCFKLARKYFPKNNLSINDGGNFAYHGNDPYYAYIKDAVEKSAPIDAVGYQFHMHFPAEKEYEMTRGYYDPARQYQIMDRYGEFGKVQITEITIPSYTWEPEDEEIQGEIIKNLYTVWFSHPKIEQIIYWNLVDGYAYVADPSPERIAASRGDMTIGENLYRGGLLRFDMSPKAAYFKLKELIQSTWHTEDSLVTDENGVIAFRGFFGGYDLLIEADKKVYERRLSLSKAGDGNFILTI